MSAPLAIDLCCGLGGWATGFLAHGFEVIGFDVEPKPYPGRLVIQDVRTLDGRRFAGARLIVASPCCREFSRHDQVGLFGRDQPPPDLSLVLACFRIAEEAGVPLVLENVRGLQRFIGRAPAQYGSRYLWGDGVPALIPGHDPRDWKKHQRRDGRLHSERRAVIPARLADHIARCYL